MQSQLWEHQRPGRDQAVCAWGIVLVLAILFGGLELLWPNAPERTSGFQLATIQPTSDTTQAADNDQIGQPGLRQSEFAFER